MGSAAARLSASQHQQKYERFLKLHPDRASKVQSTSFQQFVSNRATIVRLNDKYKKKVFRSSGPFADLSQAQFQARFLTAAHPLTARSKAGPPFKKAKLPKPEKK